MFGDGLSLAERYATWLRTAGIERGLLGPREADRVWDRHLFNSVAMQQVVPNGSEVADVGSGAGLPGLPLALARPDLTVTLIEPLLRRATFLSEVVADLGLEHRVEVIRSRAEDLADRRWDVVVSRALAPLDRLLGWCVPLTRSRGEVQALKGERAETELSESATALSRRGLTGSVAVVRAHPECEPTSVIRVSRLARSAQQ